MDHYLDKIINRLEGLFSAILPTHYILPFRFKWRRFFRKLEDEMFFVNTLLNKRRRFLDVGANIGWYSYYFSDKFKHIDAFEPIAETAHFIKAFRSRNIYLHIEALSSKKGFQEINIPHLQGYVLSGHVSLEKHDLPIIEKRIVNLNTIDSYNYNDIDLIKIDVEGHEYSVIEGALSTIKRCKPLLLVEIEQRHINRPIEDVFQLIVGLNYDGYFLFNRKLISLKKFNYLVNQKYYLDGTSTHYVNNFIFIPPSNKKN
jgi:FkbM family methyltransferase